MHSKRAIWSWGTWGLRGKLHSHLLTDRSTKIFHSTDLGRVQMICLLSCHAFLCHRTICYKLFYSHWLYLDCCLVRYLCPNPPRHHLARNPQPKILKTTNQTSKTMAKRHQGLPSTLFGKAPTMVSIHAFKFTVEIICD